MNNIVIHLSFEQWENIKYSKDDTLSIRGQVYSQNNRIDLKKLNQTLMGSLSTGSLIEEFKALNGFYSLIKHSQNRLIASVDRIRSMPLFYGTKEGKFYLSDDAEWVRVQVGDQNIDPIAKEEFQLASYVTGRNTLFENVKQLQAGEYLTVSNESTGISIQVHSYYQFLHTEPLKYDEVALRKELHEVALNATKRLIDYAQGRQIVAPLSGGYDSRLIVLLLKELGYENIFTFTYGMAGNKESQYSKQVADALGLEWYFVEYSQALWRKEWHSKARWEYQKWASGLTSLAHMQDWLAVKHLKENHVIDEDCVIVPGHTGDFISGGHIPNVAKPNRPASIEMLQNSIFNKHYILAPIKSGNIKTKNDWHTKIIEVAGIKQINTGEELANFFEKWGWQERQAKFICNSIKAYEFFDYDWWMPLWDLEFIRFWERVPLALRKGHDWYIAYVNALYASKIDEKNTKQLKNAEETVVLALMRNAINITGVDSLELVKKVKKIRRRRNVLSHYLLGQFDEENTKYLVDNDYLLNGIFSHYFLEDIERTIKV